MRNRESVPVATGAGETDGQSAPYAGVYVHFPWCLAKCPYCDFVSYVGDGGESSRYADAVVRELMRRAPRFQGRRIESIFFGGGTPSLWDPSHLGRVISAVREVLSVDARAEVTVECNPTSVDERRASALAAAGVNRLSIGVQSLRDEQLRFLGRLHDAHGAISAVRGVKLAGMKRVSADLIFGLPGQSASDACAEAQELADLGLDHVSCYQLTIEPGTRFGELARKGRLPMVEDGAVADAFLAIDETLSASGLVHYEISNYARTGEEARHNVGYWRGHEYLGLGCGAFGFVRDRARDRSRDAPLPRASGTRYRNVVEPERYMRLTHEGADVPLPAASGGLATDCDGWIASREALDGETLLRERIMLGLRLREGIDIDTAARELDVEGWTPERQSAASCLEERGRLVREGSRVRIPPAAWLWTDDTSSRLF
ncbi:MAG TPA: radical SAM family heme chaperone HemW [Polyangiaceae bacterium]|nr:radical SAM family heme chaperone HemW [Polyangiaceae bacterium]